MITLRLSSRNNYLLLTDLPVCFTIQNWPISSAEAAEALQDIIDNGKHHAVPLPAYDFNGDLIEPKRYRDTLENAVVEVHFTLEHWAIAKDKSDSYRAEVTKIVVHSRANANAVRSPKKRKPAAKLDGSPAKRSHT